MPFRFLTIPTLDPGRATMVEHDPCYGHYLKRERGHGNCSGLVWAVAQSLELKLHGKSRYVESGSPT